MPVGSDGVGVSVFTETKQEHFRKIIRAHMDIVHAVVKKHSWAENRYYFFDINCGPGIKDDEDGSPVIFLEEIARIDIDYKAIFIDINPSNVESLKTVVHENGKVSIFCGDHAEILPRIIEDDFGASLHKDKYGMLYTDPNGIFNDELLTEFSIRFPRIDILINCPATAIKRVKNCSRCSDSRTLEERIGQIRKDNWIIRDKLTSSRYQWTFLLGSNWDSFPEFRNLEMYRINSPKGKVILDDLNWTSREKRELKNLSLFEPRYESYEQYLKSADFMAVRKQVFQRSNGVCER